ncbi:MAG: hypothetical protein ACJ790_01060 [Myxococcaceae bacterium]
MPRTALCLRRIAAAAIGIALCLLSFPAAAGKLIELRGWSFAGEDRPSFTIARDTTVKHAGAASARLSAANEPKAFGSLIQSVEAQNYLGKRIRFRAWTKTSGVAGFAGLFVRVEGVRAENTLAFDNMQDRPIKGDTEWTQRSVVLDVPPSATRIHFGVMLSGKGTVWLDDGELAEVSKDVPTTGVKRDDAPKNLDFEK